MLQTVITPDPIAETVIFRISEAVHPEKIILFGSRARGDIRPDSDIDLLIIYKGAFSKRELKLRIHDLFPDQDFSMDLFVLTPEEYEWQKDVISTVGYISHRDGVVYYGF